MSSRRRKQLSSLLTMRQKQILVLSQGVMPSERSEQLRKSLIRQFNVHGDLSDKQWWCVGEMIKDMEGYE